MGILFGIISSIFYSFEFVTLKKSYEEFSPSVVFFIDMLFGFLIWIPFSLISGIEMSNVFAVFPFAFSTALLSEAFVFYVLSKGEISITGTIFASYPIYTIILSMIFLRERLGLEILIFIALTIIGTIVVSWPAKITKKDLKEKSYILWALLGALVVGVSDVISKGGIDNTSAAEFLFALAFAQIPISIVYLKMSKSKLPKIADIRKGFSNYKYLVLATLLNVSGVLFLWLTFEYTLASIASPLTASYPGLMVILAMVLLRERPKKVELVGLLVTFVGILGVSYFGA